VLQNLGLSWAPQWHYAVVIGYDTTRQSFILRSGTTARHVVAFRTFEYTWARSGYWGVVLLKPGEMPVQAVADDYLKAVVGLERMGLIKEAQQAYAAALGQWPHNLIALIGLGNTAYALDDLEGAERSFRQAIAYHPDNAVIHNNLAMVLLAQGQAVQARPFAQRALELATGDTSAYQATLEDIQREIATTEPTDSDQR
jgi:tetratricopeptide (TPR) repeat protein